MSEPAISLWTPGRWVWPLTDPEPLSEPVPYRGRQGVFYIESFAVRRSNESETP